MVIQTQTRRTIRPFTERDYPAYVAVVNATFPDYATSVEALRFGDSNRDPRCRQERFIAAVGGTIVGVGSYDQWAGMYHPRKFAIDVTIRPEWQGLGAALYERVMVALEPFAPLAVRSQGRADLERGIRFLQARGFVEGMRSWESRLAVADFDPIPFAGAEERVAAGGIAIRTILELAGDPARDRKLYELDQELFADVPSPEPHTRIPFEQFAARRLGDPDMIPEAYYIAIDAATGEYAGMGQLWHSSASADLYNGLTAVRRAYRRRGIALALKLRGIAYAQTIGAPTIKTWNETNNQGMLAINEALGFVKQPVWIDFVKTLRDEDESGIRKTLRNEGEADMHSTSHDESGAGNERRTARNP